MTARAEQIKDLKPFQARAIIEALRKGTVPVDYVPFFTVGRDQWLSFVEDDFENYIAEGGSKVRFINGDYGDGKTHFMSVIRHLAKDKGFAVSFVVLTRDVAIHKFEAVYQEVTRQLSGKNEEIGLRGMLAGWALALEKDLAGKPEEERRELIKAISQTIHVTPGMDQAFANALAAYCQLKLMPLTEQERSDEREGRLELLCQWFEGGKVAKKDLKTYQIFDVLHKGNAKRFLRSLVALLRYWEFKGLILLIDELETVMAQPTSVRDAAFENVRLLIDNTENSGHLHMFFSIIPDVLLSEKGFKSYDALWSRVRSVSDSKRLNYRSILIDLHRTPLKTEELVELGELLTSIHEVSYRWEAGATVNQETVVKVCQSQKRMGLLNEVRLFIKQMIRILDVAEQGDVVDTDQIAEQIVSGQAQDATAPTPSWDA